jgi:hypothetical protein
VQWRVGSSATLGTTTSFVGNILTSEHHVNTGRTLSAEPWREPVR